MIIFFGTYFLSTPERELWYVVVILYRRVFFHVLFIYYVFQLFNDCWMISNMWNAQRFQKLKLSMIRATLTWNIMWWKIRDCVLLLLLFSIIVQIVFIINFDMALNVIYIWNFDKSLIIISKFENFGFTCRLRLINIFRFCVGIHGFGNHL